MTHMVEVPEISFTSRVATMASMASIRMSYQPGLLPRSVGDQAILTGLTSAINYGLVAVTGSAVEGLAAAVVGHKRMQRPGVAGVTRPSRTRVPWPQVWPCTDCYRAGSPSQPGVLRCAAPDGDRGHRCDRADGLERSGAAEICRPVEAGATGGSSAPDVRAGHGDRDRTHRTQPPGCAPRCPSDPQGSTSPVVTSGSLRAAPDRQVREVAVLGAVFGLRGGSQCRSAGGGLRRIRLRGRHRASGEADVTVDESLRQLAPGIP